MSKLNEGSLFLVTAQVVELISAYVINVWIGRNLGPEFYGVFGIVMALLLWIEVIPANGLPTAIQKILPNNKKQANYIFLLACKLQFWIVLFFFGLFYLFAPYISKIIKNEDLSNSLRFVSLDIWLYSFFFLFLYLQNGLHNFRMQSILHSLVSIVKMFLIVLFVWYSKSIIGALSGKIISSALGLIMGIIFWKKAQLSKINFDQFTGKKIDQKVLLNFAVPVMLFTLGINLILNLDLWLVQYFIGRTATGNYTAASTISRIPYLLSLGLSLTILPTLSNVINKGRQDKIISIIHHTLRILLLLILPICILTLAYGKEIIIIIYSQQYQIGGEVLTILIWGHSLLAINSILLTIINSDNKPMLSFIIISITAIMHFILNILLIPAFGIHGAAFSTVLAMIIAVVISATFVYLRFRILIKIKTLLAISLAVLPVLIFSQIFKVKGMLVFPVSILLFSVYFMILLLLKEISIAELFFLRKLIKIHH